MALPDEVWAMVFEHTEPFVLWTGALKLTCRQWRRVLDDTPLLRRRAHRGRFEAYKRKLIAPEGVPVKGARALRALGVARSEWEISDLVVVQGTDCAYASHRPYAHGGPLVVRKWRLSTREYTNDPPINLRGTKMVGATANCLVTRNGINDGVNIYNADGIFVTHVLRANTVQTYAVSGEHLYMHFDNVIRTVQLHPAKTNECVDTVIPVSGPMVPDEDGEGVRIVGQKKTVMVNRFGDRTQRPKRDDDAFVHHRATGLCIRDGKLY